MEMITTLRVVFLPCFISMVYSSKSQELDSFISSIERAASQPLPEDLQYSHSRDFVDEITSYAIYDTRESMKAIHDDVRSLEVKVDSLVTQVEEINKLLKKVYEITTYSLYV